MKLQELIERLEQAANCAMDSFDYDCADAIRDGIDILRELPTTVDGEAIIPDATYFLAGGDEFVVKINALPCDLWASKDEARKQ